MTENEIKSAPMLTTNDASVLEGIADEQAIFQKRAEAYTTAMGNPDASKVQKRQALANLRHAGIAMRTSLKNLNLLSKVE